MHVMPVLILAGLHLVDVHYFECQVPGSPFPVQVWDASQVRVANVRKCIECGVDAFFNGQYIFGDEF